MKRAFDAFFSVFLILLLMPIYLLIALVVWVDLKEPPIFLQLRTGKGENRFRLMKFKTMRSMNHAEGLVSNSDRVTKLGLVLRKSSLDELPSLFNILLGDMSFVGPRPLLIDYLPYYKKSHRIRHNVRPGLTGLAQVNGRNCTTWDKRLNLDVEYVNNTSFLMDLEILVGTVFVVLSQKGVEGKDDLSIVRLDRDETYNKFGANND